jgi:hypothetical protein
MRFPLLCQRRPAMGARAGARRDGGRGKYSLVTKEFSEAHLSCTHGVLRAVNSSKLEQLGKGRISKARTVLQWTPERVPDVMAAIEDQVPLRNLKKARGGANSCVAKELGATHISRARAVLQWVPERVPDVMAAIERQVPK